MKLWPLVLLLVTVGISAPAPKNMAEQDHPAQPNTQPGNEEAQARAWLAQRQKESGQFKTVAKGVYLIKSTVELDKFRQPSEASDVWTLGESQSGEFLADGVVRPSKTSSHGHSFRYQVILNAQMRPAAYKLFGGKLVSGCVWTEAKLFCQETDGRGQVQGAAGASIGNSTKFLSLLFPFLFNGLTPNATVKAGATTYLTLLSLAYYDEPGSLIDLFPQYASLSLLGQKAYSVLQTNMQGSEFQLDVCAIPNAKATSPEAAVIPPDSEHKNQYKPLCKFLAASNGILLSATDANTQKEFVRLVQFEKIADF